jgi:glycosyltransferase involved in cell wall biosynthesis
MSGVAHWVYATSLNSAMNTAHFKKLSIFFPMWNEEEYLERALSAGRELCDVLIADGEIETYELIIIDDASTDRTPQIADALLRQTPASKWCITQ